MFEMFNIHTIFIMYNPPLDYIIIYHHLIRHLLKGTYSFFFHSVAIAKTCYNGLFVHIFAHIYVKTRT